ncbi:hypothetical protein KIN20_011430 [Parelaphostrongylus tenuis]|uniref:Uncharacterized protein n=1 Tax=Parelaphostrongylus tenuis TaxID=148309 RepID=A0AAD5MTL7_PARTN|nr:hypothetical protein KIN20_011430 [Parelaphostrongylus tenuis]
MVAFMTLLCTQDLITQFRGATQKAGLVKCTPYNCYNPVKRYYILAHWSIEFGPSQQVMWAIKRQTPNSERQNATISALFNSARRTRYALLQKYESWNATVSGI